MLSYIFAQILPYKVGWRRSRDILKITNSSDHERLHDGIYMQIVTLSWSLEFVTLIKSRSSRSQMFFKIGVLRNFKIFTGKHLCQSLFLIKLQVLLLFYRTPRLVACENLDQTTIHVSNFTGSWFSFICLFHYWQIRNTPS